MFKTFIILKLCPRSSLCLKRSGSLSKLLMLVGVQGAFAWQEPRHFCDAEAVDSVLLTGMVMSFANFSLIVEMWKWVLQGNILLQGKRLRWKVTQDQLFTNFLYFGVWFCVRKGNQITLLNRSRIMDCFLFQEKIFIRCKLIYGFTCFQVIF